MPIEPGYLAVIVQSAMDAVITVDGEHRITLFNAAAEQMFRCPAAQAMGQPLDLFIPNRYREVHRKHLAQFSQEGVTTRAMGHLRPLWALRADGDEFPIEASISYVEVDGKKLFTAIVRDVTARVQAEHALQEAQARFRAIFEHAGIGIAMSDTHGTLLEVNAALEHMLGYSDAELRGMAYVQITHPRDVPVTLQNLAALAAGKVERYELEKRYVTKDGKRVWGRVICSAVRDAQGKARFFVKMIEDITARKRAQARARKARLEHAAERERLDTLTPRERQVLWGIVAGKATKVIALELGASPKTIEVHRARVMEKLQAQSIAQLVQMMLPLRPADDRPDAAKLPSSQTPASSRPASRSRRANSGRNP